MFISASTDGSSVTGSDVSEHQSLLNKEQLPAQSLTAADDLNRELFASNVVEASSDLERMDREIIAKTASFDALKEEEKRAWDDYEKLNNDYKAKVAKHRETKYRTLKSKAKAWRPIEELWKQKIQVGVEYREHKYLMGEAKVELTTMKEARANYVKMQASSKSVSGESLII